MLISELLRLAIVIQSPLPRVQVYIYIYANNVIYSHIVCAYSIQYLYIYKYQYKNIF